MLLFLRNEPEIFNIGDLLCTPKYYFDFRAKCIESTNRELFTLADTIIFGGGAFINFGEGYKFPYEKTVAWGIGSSVETLPHKAELPYRKYGIRDPDSVIEEENLIPCVSCLHPLVKIEPGKDTSIFVSSSPVVSINTDSLEDISSEVYSNGMDEISFIRAFRRTGKVITNSYHVAYWALLSGRSVSVLGFSSKFRSLFKLLGLNPENVNSFNKPINFREIAQEIEGIIDRDDFVNLVNYQEVRDYCIVKNIKFARTCVEQGLLPDFDIHKMVFGDMVKRKVKSRWKSSHFRDRLGSPRGKFRKYWDAISRGIDGSKSQREDRRRGRISEGEGEDTEAEQ